MRGAFHFDNRNFILPVDAEIEDRIDVRVQGVSIDEEVLGRMSQAEPLINILLLDSCRNNPFEKGAGAEVQLSSLARAIHDSSNVVQNAMLFNHGLLEEEMLSIGLAVSVLDERELSSLDILTMIRRKIQTFQPHVIHTHGYKENILGSFAARLTNDVPCMRTVHGASEYSDHAFRRKILTGLDNIAARYVQKAIVAVSTELCSVLRDKFGDKVTFIPNGIDEDAPGEEPRQQRPIPRTDARRGPRREGRRYDGQPGQPCFYGDELVRETHSG